MTLEEYNTREKELLEIYRTYDMTEDELENELDALHEQWLAEKESKQ